MVREVDAMIMHGYRLTLAEIVYYHPDHPGIINPHSFIWQRLGLAPRFPGLRRFLRFWQAELDGRIHSVKVCSEALIRPA